MNEQQYKELVEKIGKEAADQIKKEMANVEAKAKTVAEEAVKSGGVTKEAFTEYQAAAKALVDKLEDVTKKQGTDINELREKLSGGDLGNKSIAEVLEENKEELRKVYANGSGSKYFMVGLNKAGQYVMTPFDPTAKGAAVHATVGGIGAGGNVASIAQSLDAASLLRIGGNVPIIGQFRNTPWVFDLCNLINASIDTPLAIWFEEVAKQGGSATVGEGQTKPITQYAYELKSASYKKEATLIGITDEFAMDFSRLESDILGKGRIDVINRLNTSILGNITTSATTYNTQASFNAGLLGVEEVNDFDVLAALAAQVDNSTYGSMANAAVMSTFKKYRMGITKSTQGEYVDRPSVLDNLAFVGNPAMAADNVMVGDFKNYNIILRGGFIVKVGYNGTDFAENKFSVVMEQFYYDYISEIRKKAIVKGQTFKTVRDLIGYAGS